MLLQVKKVCRDLLKLLPENAKYRHSTTYAVEGFHRMLRKYNKIKTIYATDESVRKSIYLSIQEITRKWSMLIKNWGTIIGQLMIFYEDRFVKTT